MRSEERKTFFFLILVSDWRKTFSSRRIKLYSQSGEEEKKKTPRKKKILFRFYDFLFIFLPFCWKFFFLLLFHSLFLYFELVSRSRGFFFFSFSFSFFFFFRSSGKLLVEIIYKRRLISLRQRAYFPPLSPFFYAASNTVLKGFRLNEGGV